MVYQTYCKHIFIYQIQKPYWQGYQCKYDKLSKSKIITQTCLLFNICMSKHLPCYDCALVDFAFQNCLIQTNLLLTLCYLDIECLSEIHPLFVCKTNDTDVKFYQHSYSPNSSTMHDNTSRYLKVSYFTLREYNENAKIAILCCMDQATLIAREGGGAEITFLWPERSIVIEKS